MFKLSSRYTASIYFTSRNFFHRSTSIQRPISSTQARDCRGNRWKTCSVRAAAAATTTKSVLLILGTSDTNKHQESLEWCRWIAKCWQSSACSYEIVPNISLQPTCCSPRVETNSYKMSQISTMSVVSQVSDLALHYALPEIIVVNLYGKKKCTPYFWEWIYYNYYHWWWWYCWDLQTRASWKETTEHYGERRWVLYSVR